MAETTKGSTQMRSFVTTAALAIALAACGGKPPEEAPKTAPVEKVKTLEERDPQAYKDNIGSAMNEVPEAYRAEFSRALSCTLSTGGDDGKRGVLTAALVREVTAKIKAGQTADTICQNGQGTTP